MSAWKRVALQKLPEYRLAIETAERPMALWIELRQRFTEVYRAEIPDEDLIRRFYEFAAWCLECPGDGKFLSDAGTAVAHAFYEHLPQNSNIRRDMPRWFSRDDFEGLQEVFRYHQTEEQFTAFEADFLRHVKKGVSK